MLSLVIPSRNEIFLQKTILDVLKKATGEIEIFPVLDGYEPPSNELIDDSRVHYVRLPQKEYTQKRHGINLVVNELAKGKYVASADAHCMFAEGFDEVLVKDLEENEITAPRRNRLDAENWCSQIQSDNRPPIDYEYIMAPWKFEPMGFHGFKWDAKTLERLHIPIDETMAIQASFWLMHKSWYQKNNFMKISGYTGWGQESEELVFTTYKNGGRVLTNKNTEFFHLHKGARYGRMYYMSRQSTRECNSYCYNYWVHEQKDFFIKFINRFMPLPGWSGDWEKKIYG